MQRICSIFWLGLFWLTTGYTATYWGGEYRTRDTFVYGRFEARYKPPVGNGVLASFFTYHDFTSSQNWNEIDFEILGRYDDDVQVTSIGPGQTIRKSHQFVPFKPQDDFHTYAFEWTPEYIAWFIDGLEVYRQDQEHVRQFYRPQKIMMNLWSPEYENWVGPWDERILPVFAYYDWVSYADYTPGMGSTGTNNNFTLRWRDDFDNWDQNRWQKATHTFGGNRVTFHPDNVIFKDGMMVLCLTKDPIRGYTDSNPPAVFWARALGDTVMAYFSEDVETNSAETKTNYVITGAIIQQAQLQLDRRTVKLAVTGLNPDKNYHVATLSIKDRWQPANRLVAQMTPIVMGKPLNLPVKINVGGPAWRDYLADQVWGPEVEYGHLDGREERRPTAVDVLNTDEDSLYYREREEVVGYKIRLANGHYKVVLKMAEMEFTEAGSRIFDIIVEGQRVTNRLDLVAQVGAQTAYELVIDPVVVQDGILDLHFTSLWNNAVLSGMVVMASTSEVKQGMIDASPRDYVLVQNYPNPFNVGTTIQYTLTRPAQVQLVVFDALGRQTAKLLEAARPAGTHQIQWQPDLPSGLYFLQINATVAGVEFNSTQKTLLLR